MPRLTLPIFMAAALSVHTTWAADPFVGAWKLDPARTQLTDQMKVERAGPNRFTFELGAGPETIVTDGSDQPGYGGTTLAVSVLGPDAWKVVRKKGGRMLLTADWRLSQDGNTLTDDFTSIGSDGSQSKVKYVYARTAGDSGFTGTWESTSEKVDSVFVIRFQPDQADGLALTYPSGVTKDMRFDGKDHLPAGANATEGAAFSARRLGAGDIELTDKYQGKVVATERLTLSADGKTLTQTVSAPGKRRPNVLVYVRQ